MYLFMGTLLNLNPSLTTRMAVDEKEELRAQLLKIYEGNTTDQEKINEFVETYAPTTAIRWYTRDSPLYVVLNRALREINLKLLLPFRFFIVDIYHHLEILYQNQRCSNTTMPGQRSSHSFVYRGQLMWKNAVLRIKNSIDGYISTNSFLSTTRDREIAMRFIRHVGATLIEGLKPILLEIKINPTLNTVPYADISMLSTFHTENEVLFAPGSILKIQGVFDDNEDDEMCIVRLELCDRKEKDLDGIVSYWKQNIESQSPLMSFGSILLKTKQYQYIEQLYLYLLAISTSNTSWVRDCFQVLGNLYLESGNWKEAINYHKRAINEMDSTNCDNEWLAKAYSYIADAYMSSGEDAESALKYYEVALTLFKQTDSKAYQDIAKCLNNMGEIYYDDNNDDHALISFKKALELDKKIHLKDPYNLIQTLKMESRIHCLEHQYELALKCLKEALKISQKNLDENDPEIGALYEEIGDIHLGSEDFILALSTYQKAAEIYYYSCSQQDERNQEIQRVIKYCNIGLK